MSRLQPPSKNFFADLGITPLQQESRLILLSHASSILRQRIQIMSSATGNDWLEYCSWDKVEGETLRLALAGARGYAPAEKLLGYHCADHETYLAFVVVTIHGLGHVYNDNNECQLYLHLCLAVEESTHQFTWKLNSIALEFPSGIVDQSQLVQSLEELEHASRVLQQPEPTQYPMGETANEQEDPDDYWGQYDDEAGNEVVSRHESEDGSVDYYDRYDSQVETAIQAPDDSRPRGISTNGPDKKEYPSLLPDIVHYAESSLRNLRTLCHAANLTDEQIVAIFKKVMEEPTG